MLESQSRHKTLMRVMGIGCGIALALGMTGCAIQMPQLQLFPSTSQQTGTSQSQANASDANKSKNNGTSHTANDNDKLAYYTATSADGKYTVTSVIFLTRSDGQKVKNDTLKDSLSQLGINWYQFIIDTSTGDNNIKEGAYLYLPSGLSYDQIVAVKTSLTNAGYVCEVMTKDEYDAFVNQQYSLYHVQTCYMGPASDE
jgi:hypothetical protein